MDEAISKHIFLFPFKWEVKSDKNTENTSLLARTNLAGFKKTLDKNLWQEYTFSIKEPEARELNPYNEYAYFYDHVRTILNLVENADSYQYNYKIPKEKKAIYRISILGETPEMALELEIDDIFLNFYDSGVAVFGFILTNRLVTSFARVLKINEYGRRIYPQFLKASTYNDKEEKVGLTLDTKFNFLADKVELIGLHIKTIEEKFEHYDTYAKLGADPFKLPAHIGELVGNNFKTGAYNTLATGDIKVTPIIDDRMFVMSFLFENSVVKKLSEFCIGKEEYTYLNSNEWFRYVFIDDSNPSCTSQVMKRKLLAGCTYDRWVGNIDKDGKDTSHLFGISRYSFVMLSADEWFTRNIIYLHFSNMYFQIVLLSLVQRASIISYAGEVTRIVDKIKKDEVLSDQEIRDINSLAQSFLVFKNQIYFREITPQDQGIEIYNIVHQQMNIKNEVEALETEIEDLIGFVNTASDARRGKEAQILTRLATWFLPAGFIIGMMSINAYDADNMVWGGRIDWAAWGWIAFAIALSYLCGRLILNYINKKIKN